MHRTVAILSLLVALALALPAWADIPLDDVYFWPSDPSTHSTVAQPATNLYDTEADEEDEPYIEYEEWRQGEHVIQVVMRIHTAEPVSLPGPTPSCFSTLDAALLHGVAVRIEDTDNPLIIKAHLHRY